MSSAKVQVLGPALPFGFESKRRVSHLARLKNVIRRSEFVIGWQIQARLSSPLLVILIAALPLQLGVIFLPVVALGWGVAACSYYEFRRRHGVACLHRDPREVAQGKEATSKRPILGWLGYLLKVVFLLGVVNVLTTKVLCRLHHRYRSRGEVDGLGARAILVIGIGKSGVMAARHFLEKAGYPKKRIYQLNLLGRLLEVPFKMADVWVLYIIYLVIPLPNISKLPLFGVIWLVGVTQLIFAGDWV